MASKLVACTLQLLFSLLDELLCEKASQPVNPDQGEKYAHIDVRESYWAGRNMRGVLLVQCQSYRLGGTAGNEDSSCGNALISSL